MRSAAFLGAGLALAARPGQPSTASSGRSDAGRAALGARHHAEPGAAAHRLYRACTSIRWRAARSLAFAIGYAAGHRWRRADRAVHVHLRRALVARARRGRATCRADGAAAHVARLRVRARARARWCSMLLAIFGDDTRRPVEVAQHRASHARSSTALCSPLVFRHRAAVAAGDPSPAAARWKGDVSAPRAALRRRRVPAPLPLDGARRRRAVHRVRRAPRSAPARRRRRASRAGAPKHHARELPGDDARRDPRRPGPGARR